MTVYVECEDPRVLAEWPRERMLYGRPTDEPMCGGPNGLMSAEHYEAHLSEGWVYRLVFPDAESAAEALAVWAREGRNVEWFDDGVWVKNEDTEVREFVADLPSGFRIGPPAAPEAPTEEPRPEPWRAVIDGPCVEPRPALPEGVEPVAICDVPREVGAWEILHQSDTQQTGEQFELRLFGPKHYLWDDRASAVVVLARPVPSPPEPETERVPWWEAVGRKATADRTIVKVEQAVVMGTTITKFHTEPTWQEADGYAGPSVDGTIVATDDGCVEVLVQP